MRWLPLRGIPDERRIEYLASKNMLQQCDEQMHMQGAAVTNAKNEVSVQANLAKRVFSAAAGATYRMDRRGVNEHATRLIHIAAGVCF